MKASIGGTNCIIMDNGSSTIKIGRSGYIKPTVLIGHEKWASMIGDDVQFPITKGIFNNWENTSLMWREAFYNQLKLQDMSNHSIFVCSSPILSQYGCTQMMELLFEEFNVPAFLSKNNGILSCCSYGCTAGTVVDIGYKQTFVIPILGGEPIYPGYAKLDIGGNDITKCLFKLLRHSYPNHGFDKDWNTIDKIKHKFSYMNCNNYTNMNGNSNNNIKLDSKAKYKLPDGKSISIKQERYLCTEVLFNTCMKLNANVNSKKSDGIDTVIIHCINQCHSITRPYLYDNIILCGGGSMITNIDKRLGVQLLNLEKNSEFCVRTLHDRKYAAWIGASVYESSMQDMNEWTDKPSYYEYGCKNIYLRKNFTKINWYKSESTKDNETKHGRMDTNAPTQSKSNSKLNKINK